ncbi:uncharacterized protein LOC127367511 isoform X2 [Dicentrarchus labrax]|uniref:uncharacterized protein LOC127367511 isoform X2 n=1 Tax=Dicentrarchus labrax TaxID=13489 RepID=UPI0021F52383|nr:uncharacterized protein LOC127367511 isoform X2 [Dicentrarchus labrax]
MPVCVCIHWVAPIIFVPCHLVRDMLEIILSIVTEWALSQWIFLHVMVSGTCSLVTIHQPPVLTTALGHDVVMPCHLTHDEKMLTPSVLYWTDTNNVRVWRPSENYEGRVDLLDHDVLSLNKSLLLRKVKWTDGRKYLCKVSITLQDKRFRMSGNGTLLMVYDTVNFKPTSHNQSLLCCEVNVTQGPGFVLSIFHIGYNLQTVDTAPGNVSALPYVTLSQTIYLRNKGKYECQLHLNEELVAKNIYYHLPEPDVEVFPEPWFLYVALLLVPVTILLSLVTAMLMYRCCVCLP